MLKKLNNLFFTVLIFLSSALFAQEIYNFTNEESSNDSQPKEGEEDVNKNEEKHVVKTEEVVIEEDTVNDQTIVNPRLKTVFDKDDIEKSGAKTVADIIEMAPGVRIVRLGGILEPQMISIRGGEFRHILVLLDGKDITSLWEKNSNISAIPLSNIERIEIIRGAAASFYGEGAVSGVINIITKNEQSDFTFGVEYGYASFNTHLLNSSITIPLGKNTGWSSYLNIGGLFTEGNYEYKNIENEVKRHNNQGWYANLFGKLKFAKTDNTPIENFNLDGTLYISKRGSPGLMEFLTPSAQTENLKTTTGTKFLFAECPIGVFSTNIDFSFTDNTYTNDDIEINENNKNISVITKASWEKKIALEKVFFNMSASTGYCFGYLYSTNLTDNSGAAVDGIAFEHSTYLNTNVNIMYGNFDIVPAIRLDLFFDDYTSIATKYDLSFSWSASAGWAPFRTDEKESPLYFRINGGTAYKNPSFQDLFWPQGALAAGNPDLLKEKSISGDFGIVYNFQEIKRFSMCLELSAYLNRINNLIQWLPSAGGIWRPSNVGIVLSGGIDSSFRLSYTIIPKELVLTIDGLYNWLSCKNADSLSVNYNKQLAYRPEHSGSLFAKILLKDKLWLNISGNYIGYRFTNNSDTKYLEDVFILSAASGFEITKKLIISATADNLFNTCYTDKMGYPVPGFEFGIKGEFKF